MKCNQCQKEIPEGSENCPQCNPKTIKIGVAKYVYGTLTAICLFLALMVIGAKTTHLPVSNDDLNICVIARIFVEKEYNFPEGTNFQNYYGYEINKQKNGNSLVHLYADVKNEKNLTTRIYYIVEVEQVEENKWSVVDIKIDENEKLNK